MKQEAEVKVNRPFSVAVARERFFDGCRNVVGNGAVNMMLSGDNLYPMFSAIFDALENNPTGFREMASVGQGADYIFNVDRGRQFDDWQGLGFMPAHSRIGMIDDELKRCFEPKRKELLLKMRDETQMDKAAAIGSYFNISSGIIGALDDYNKSPRDLFVYEKMAGSEDDDKYETVCNEWEELSKSEPGFEKLFKEEREIVDSMRKTRLRVLSDNLVFLETGKWPEPVKSKDDSVFDGVFYTAFHQLLNRYPWDG